MSRLFLRLLPVLIPVLLTGCTTVRGTSTTLFESPLPMQGASIALSASQEMDRLEWSAFRRHFATSLEAVGYKAPVNGDGNVHAVVSWGVDTDPAEATEVNPILNAQGKITGFSTSSRIEHLRWVVVRFYSSDPRFSGGAQVVKAQVRVVSKGSSADIASVMPAMAQMAFAEWPTAVNGHAYDLEIVMND